MMTSQPWFRLYAELVNDPKVQRLDGDTFKSWINILCIAAQNGGKLPPDEDIAFTLRRSVHDVATLLSRLLDAGLIDRRQGGANGMHYAPHAWDKRQFKSDSSTERVKRFRDSKRNVSETAPETEADTETEKENIHSLSAQAIAAAFEAFWLVYPARDGANPKVPAERAFAAAVARGADASEIIAGAKRYADEERVRGNVGSQYVATASKWLEACRWQDHPPAPAPADQQDMVFLESLSPEFAAWTKHAKANGQRPRPAINSMRGGGFGNWFPSRFPPDMKKKAG